MFSSKIKDWMIYFIGAVMFFLPTVYFFVSDYRTWKIEKELKEAKELILNLTFDKAIKAEEFEVCSDD